MAKNTITFKWEVESDEYARFYCWITFHISSTKREFTIDWGDGKSDIYDDVYYNHWTTFVIGHQYGSDGVYQVTIQTEEDCIGISLSNYDYDCFCALWTELDVSNAPNLVELNCSELDLDKLDLSKNTKLRIFNYTYSHLTSGLDISQNCNLEELRCYCSSLTDLDVSHNPKLRTLDCGGNQLEKLNISKNTLLEKLDVSGSSITELNVNNNPKLKKLCCPVCYLSELDVSRNIELTEIECFGNRLTILDLSQNPLLEKLDCNNNPLKSLKLHPEVFKNWENEYLNELKNELDLEIIGFDLRKKK